MKDCFGRTLCIGDLVAHVERNGSHVHLSPRRVVSDNPFEVEWVNCRGETVRTRPHKEKHIVLLSYIGLEDHCS